MLMLLLQTFLILLSAFLVGAALACLMKRAFLGEPIPLAAPVVDAVAPVKAISTVSAPALAPKIAEPSPNVDRFGHALAGTTAGAPMARPVTLPVAPVVEVQPSEPVVQRPAPPPPPPPLAPVVAAKPIVVPATAAAATTIAAAVAAAPIPEAAVPAAFTSLAMDDLTRIKGIDAVVQSRINALGVRRYWQIAGWDGNDVSQMSQSLGFADRINDENWASQARVLATGAETDYAARRRLGLPEPEEVAAAEAAKALEAEKAAEAAKAAETAKALEAEKAAEAAKAVETAKALEAEKAAEAAKAAETAKSNEAEKAAEEAKTTEAAVAAKAQEDAQAAEAARVAAAAVAVASATAAAGAAAAAAATQSASRPAPEAPAAEASPRSDLTHLRSVRSEALRGEPVAAGARTSGAFDDLKRIRGVGVLIEKKLNSLAVTTYEQVANWTSADIDRVSQLLDFKGRIERENWVEQARILASGGQTEFSRRVDRGEV